MRRRFASSGSRSARRTSRRHSRVPHGPSPVGSRHALPRRRPRAGPAASRRSRTIRRSASAAEHSSELPNRPPPATRDSIDAPPFCGGTRGQERAAAESSARVRRNVTVGTPRRRDGRGAMTTEVRALRACYVVIARDHRPCARMSPGSVFADAPTRATYANDSSAGTPSRTRQATRAARVIDHTHRRSRR